jgi:hypothetical protein
MKVVKIAPDGAVTILGEVEGRTLRVICAARWEHVNLPARESCRPRPAVAGGLVSKIEVARRTIRHVPTGDREPAVELLSAPDDLWSRPDWVKAPDQPLNFRGEKYRDRSSSP